MRILYAYLSIFVVFFTLISGVYALEYSGRLRVTEVEDHSISLSWEEQEGAASYIVYYDYTDTLDPADPQYFEQSDPVTTTSTIVANLEADAYFSFVVVALDDAGNESENTSNQVTVKTFQERPAFALDQNDVFVEDSKKIIVGFTRVLDLEAPQEVRVFDLDSGGVELAVKGYLPGTDDLRKLQVFMTDPLVSGHNYRMEVISLSDAQGESIADNQTKIKEFLASFEDPTLELDSAGATEPAPEYDVPVEIDSLPVTGPREIGLLFVAMLVLAMTYVFFRFRRS